MGNQKKKQNQPPQPSQQSQQNQAAQIQTTQAAPQNQVPQEIQKNLVDNEVYKEYIELRFIQHEGGVLREQYEKQVARLESELKKCQGEIPNKTVTAAFGNEIRQLQKGVPVPVEVSDFIKSKGHFDYYFN